MSGPETGPRTDVSTFRSTLGSLGEIPHGMIWSPSHGDTAFTAPLFDEFMKRIMPRKEWRTN
jgi:hypothetical protein